MNAAALIVLILALIGLGVMGYYAMICLQFQEPKRRRLPKNSDMGPLLSNEEDYNGNHEEPIRTEEGRPSELPEASAPKPEEDDDHASKDGDLETPMKSVSFQTTPECASIKPSSKEGSIALDIDEEPPVLDNSKSVLQPPHDRVVGPKTTAVNLQKSQNETPPHLTENETRYNVMSDGYDEDGLLVPGSRNKGLLKEPRKRLHAQRSAPPEGYVPHQQLFVQRNTQPQPKHVQFANPQSPGESTVPVLVSSLHEDNIHQPVRPKLKSPLSDPGINKEKNIFVFGANHEREVHDEKPVKKVKIADEDNISDVSDNIPTCNQSTPAVGWVVNLPQHTPNVSEKEVIVLDIEDIENERPKTLPLATSETDHASVRVYPKVFTSPGYISTEKKVMPKELEEVSCVTDSDNSNSDDASNLHSKELRLHDEPREESGSESSEPDLTEYSFERGPHTPDPAVSIVLQNEVSCYLENKIGLTHYVPIPETIYLSKSNQQPVPEINVIGQPPPTPTSDTKSISPISSNDNSLDEIKAPSPTFNPTNVLGTPPQTPPVDNTSTYIPEGPTIIATNDSAPSFIVIDTHNSQRRSSSDSLSSSLSSSSSSSNGSYKLDATTDLKNVQETGTEKPDTVKVRIIRD